jgi:hypothetical protein
MRDPARIDRIAKKLVRIWKASPDLRLGQLVTYAALAACDNEKERVWSVEDDEIEAALDMLWDNIYSKETP